jgi:hypothetical protein
MDVAQVQLPRPLPNLGAKQASILSKDKLQRAEAYFSAQHPDARVNIRLEGLGSLTSISKAGRQDGVLPVCSNVSLVFQQDSAPRECCVQSLCKPLPM